MSTITTEKINVTELNHARFVEFNDRRLRIDELTEASEKLAMVMHNPFEFEMRGDGELYAEDGSNLGEVLRNSLAIAEEAVLTNPQFITELIRRRIELQEYDEQRRLALGNDDDPDVLVVISPIPDAVVRDGIDLGAYDPRRKKTLVRVFQRTENGIRSTSISLDGTHREGLQAIARQFGQTITDDEGSEDILAKRFWGYTTVVHDPVKTVRRRYDEQLERHFGGQWYGGRQDGDVIDALSFIMQQTDIVEAHLQRMKALPSSDKEARAAAQHDFAASLDERRMGNSAFGDTVDLAGSGEVARAEGREYKSDCPTLAEITQNQNANESSLAQKAAKKLYEKGEIKAMRCLFCKFTTYGDPCAFRLVCTRCTAEVRGGRIISRGIGRAMVLANEAKAKAAEETKARRGRKVARHIAAVAMPAIVELDGKFYENKEVVGIGGMTRLVREISRDEWARYRHAYAKAA